MCGMNGLNGSSTYKILYLKILICCKEEMHSSKSFSMIVNPITSGESLTAFVREMGGISAPPHANFLPSFALSTFKTKVHDNSRSESLNSYPKYHLLAEKSPKM